MAQKTESRHKRVIQCFDSTPLAADVMISTHYDDLIQPLSPNPPLVSESEPDLKNVTNEIAPLSETTRFQPLSNICKNKSQQQLLVAEQIYAKLCRIHVWSLRKKSVHGLWVAEQVMTVSSASDQLPTDNKVCRICGGLSTKYLGIIFGPSGIMGILFWEFGAPNLHRCIIFLKWKCTLLRSLILSNIAKFGKISKATWQAIKPW